MKLKGLFGSIFATTPAPHEPAPAEPEHSHQRTRRRSSVTMYVAHAQLKTIIDEDADPYYKVQNLGKSIVLTSATVVSALFHEILVPEKHEYLIVPLIEGIIESKKESHSLAVLNELLFDFMIPTLKTYPTTMHDLDRLGRLLATTLRQRILDETGETKQAIASAKDHILPQLEAYIIRGVI